MTEAVLQLKGTLDRLLDGKKIEHVLEAGCGSASHISIAGDTCLTGIDISEKQLARNQALDEKILGDLQNYALPESRFDVIICWDVLEHLPQPERALENFVRALKEDGMIILAFPNLYSLKGIVTKFTPFLFHVWVRRHLFGERDAGKDDNGPFPTFLKSAIAPAAIKQFARERGLGVEFFCLYESEMHQVFKERHSTLGVVWSALGRLTQLLTFNRLAADLTDCIILLRKLPKRV